MALILRSHLIVIYTHNGCEYVIIKVRFYNDLTGVLHLDKCSMCGNEFDIWDEQENFRFEHKVGYGSVHDGEYIKINLCCDCFDKVIDIISPLCKTNPVHENQCDF